MSVQIKGVVPSQTKWRFNTHLLSSEKFVEVISDQIDIFLSINKTTDISASVLWETLKAYIRGQAMRENKKGKNWMH